MAGESSTSAGFTTSFQDINIGLFGEDTEKEVTGAEAGTITTREQLKIDEEGIIALITDALSGVGGLAEIFGEEQAAGLFKTTAAKKGTEDLFAGIAGELAKLTGVKTRVEERDLTTEQRQAQESKGILDRVLSPFGAIF